MKLKQSAEDLYDLIRKDGDVKANVGEPVVVNDKPRAVLTAFTPKNREANLLALEHILHSLSYIASHLSKQLRYIGIPLNQDGYGQATAYKHISFPAIQRVVYALHLFQLEDKPFLEIIPGTYDRTKGMGQVTRIEASRPALDWFTQKGLILPDHPNTPDQIYDPVPVHLRLKPFGQKEAKRGDPLYRPLQGTEMVLPVSLASLKNAKLSLPLPDYAFYVDHWSWAEKRSKLMATRRADLYRSFSGEDGRGGRIYGHWVQMLPADARQYLTFRNQSSVELDYSSMQLALLYHLHGIPMPEGELYEIPGTRWSREACKAVLRISVGSSSKTQTVKSLANELLAMRLKASRADELYEAFWDHHVAVRPHTPGSDAPWLELQAIEAKITLKVLCYLAQQNIPAVPIHDSFLVPAKYEAECHDAMRKGFADYAHGISVMIKSTGGNSQDT
ncbi:hypothetical protein [Sulfitobacter dubius]|uniref:hypothetical protein n=1 Tax=Sulfitobacter dubius TaxID=218673 RepID=UPI0022AE58D9|nr:hypothetical protein [Sulfitobacter dubius]MCZ4368782.1 hypothetical protein [Sulfitobacter dubius]